MNNKVEIKYTEDKVEKVIIVKKPNAKILGDAKFEMNKTFSKLVKEGIISRSKIDDYMFDQGLWTDEKTEELREITERILDNENKIARGGIKQSEARDIAIQMRVDRGDFVRLTLKRNEMDENTVEGQSEATRFNYLVTKCLLDEKGDCIFKDIDDYNERGSEDHFVEAASALSKMEYSQMDDDWESKLPENKFLLKYGFVNEDLSLINTDGHLVNAGGDLINDKGQYVDENEHRIDRDGIKLDEEGAPMIEFLGFLDEEGNVMEEKPKKRGRPKKVD